MSRKPSRASLGACLKQRPTASRVAKTRKLGRTCRTSSSMLPNRPVGGHTGWEDTRPMQVVFLNEVEPEKLGACGCRWTEEPASSVVRGAACLAAGSVRGFCQGRALIPHGSVRDPRACDRCPASRGAISLPATPSSSLRQDSMAPHTNHGI